MPVPYLVPAQLRSVPGLSDTAAYPDALLARMVAVFEALAESYRGVAFTPRTATLNVPLGAAFTCPLQRLYLPRPRVRSVTSVTVDGTAVDAADFEVGDVAGGVTVVYSAAGWVGAEAVVVFEHGFDAPDSGTWPEGEMLLEACRTYVRAKVKQAGSGVSRDAISIAGPDGGTTRYSTPDVSQGRPTGYLEVDELLNLLPDYRIPGAG